MPLDISMRPNLDTFLCWLNKPNAFFILYDGGLLFCVDNVYPPYYMNVLNKKVNYAIHETLVNTYEEAISIKMLFKIYD